MIKSVYGLILGSVTGFVNKGCRIQSGMVLVGTCRTKANEFEFMSGDFEIGALFELMGNADMRLRRGIENLVALETTHVVMFIDDAVEPFEAASQLQFLNFAALGKNVEVAIHRSEADAGHAFANHFINFISAGMRSDAAKLFQDDLTLPRHPEV